MSLAAESPVHSSSSSDDFAALLDAELELISLDSSLDTDHENYEEYEEEDFANPKAKRRKLNQKVEQEFEESTVVETTQESTVVETTQESTVVETTQESTVVETTRESIATSSKSVHENVCPPHPGFIKGMCMICGQLEDDESGVALGYIHKDLRLASAEIDRLRGADLKNLLRSKKLILILDLDHTLLNSTRITDISADEEYVRHQVECTQFDATRSIFKLKGMHLMTKLRPFVRTFLQEAKEMFEMYIYTMAERSYALEIAKILDPDKIYFDSRVISQSDSTVRHQKGLDVVLGSESAVVILDDTELVWQRHKENLILMERYHFFSSSCRQYGFNAKSLAELKKDEREEDGALSNILNVLRRAHQMFFDSQLNTDISSRDVREVLKSIRQEILKGCKIVFSRIYPSKAPAEDQPIWKLALQLGATCSAVHDLSVTHVVSTDRNTEKARWALLNKKFLVTPNWIEAANFLWMRQPEDGFEIPCSSSSEKPSNTAD